MNSDLNNAKSFVSFLRKQKCIIPEVFITKYHNLTKDNFVSLSDCIDWLSVTRDNIIKTLRKTYKINTDFFEINYEEEDNITKFGKHILNVKSSTKTFFKLTANCFKNLSMSSNSPNGKLTKKYYIDMERIVKDFNNEEITRLKNENSKLKRTVNPKKISSEEGLYVWHYNDELRYRIGSGKELQRRIDQHDSSHADDVTVDCEVISGCYKDLESIILRIFDSKRYRYDKDFFECDIKKIRTTIKKVNNLLLEFRNNCGEEPSKNSYKKTSKKSSKKTSKNSSKKISKKISKKSSKKISKKY
jgi:hypothetical protein